MSARHRGGRAGQRATRRLRHAPHRETADHGRGRPSLSRPRSAEQALGWGWTFGTLLLVVALGLTAARALPQPVSRRTALLAAPVATSLLMLSLPLRNTLWLGQTSKR
ncbi:hypothetical protein [Streptomyces sp. 378]|uniref:hypothetical protein n=1 Tax=Streptomyces sp. 378 TaxID=3049412 RepID=UPI0024C36BBC|nr:hypothetical protein [Streptomyces sp. 378]